MRITIVLMLAIGGLTTIAVGAVLLISAYASLKNTVELTEKRAELTVAAIERGVADNLAQGQNLLDDIAARVANGSLDLADRTVAGATLSGALATAPQLGGAVIYQPDTAELWVRRAGAGQILRRDIPGAPRKQFEADAAIFKGGQAMVWGQPAFFDQQTFVDLRKPLYRNGQLVGMVATGTSLSNLSKLVAELAVDNVTPFVLYGDDKVLAHPSLVDPHYIKMLMAGKTLLSIAEINDPVLAGFPGLTIRVANPNGLDVRDTGNADGSSVILSRQTTAYGAVPWRIGAYAPIETANRQFRRLQNSIMVGLAMLLASVAAAVFLARRIARPISALSAAAEKIERLELDTIEPLRGSIIRELDEQARSFNRMVQGLRWFQAYVPRRLVQRLMNQTGGPVRDVQAAELTVMFTDVVGFTSLSETLPPAQIVSLLNEHFGIINAMVEAENGTLDKFIGDAAMAFWGAPDPLPDHAARACRAALAIADAITALTARSTGPSLRIKIGLHSGPLIVGNIGALTRMNYTVIGDTVNVCARIEALAGSYTDDQPATILVSGQVVAAVGHAFTFAPVGDQHVKGREEAVAVWRLLGAKV